MSTKPKQPATSVQAEIHVTINGQLHKLTKAEAIKLRDSLDEDGRHRVMRAMLEGLPTIKAVRFPENPEPDKIET